MKTRPNLVVAAIAAIVIVLAIVTGVLVSNREQPQLDLSTPEGTVQAFVLAVADGDDEAAIKMLDPKLGCKAPLANFSRPTRASVTVVSSKTNGATATVILDITEYGDGILNSWSHRETFQLRSTGTGWLISGEPWPVYSCK